MLLFYDIHSVYCCSICYNQDSAYSVTSRFWDKGPSFWSIGWKNPRGFVVSSSKMTKWYISCSLQLNLIVLFCSHPFYFCIIPLNFVIAPLLLRAVENLDTEFCWQSLFRSEWDMCFLHLRNPEVMENAFPLGDTLSLCFPGNFVMAVFLGNGRSGGKRRGGRSLEFPCS